MLVLDMLRHGAIEGAAPGLFYGKTDYPLSEVGRQQALDAGSRFADEKYDAIYCSPLLRARQTLELVSSKTFWSLENVVYDESFEEMNLGNLEGYTYDELCREYPQIADSMQNSWDKTEFDGGESIASFASRIKRGLEPIIKRDDERILIVCHGGVIKAAICILMNLPSVNSTQFHVEFASMTRFHISGAWASMRALNF